MGLHKVHQPANNGKTQCAGQGSEHIEAPKFTVAQAKRDLPF